MKKFKNINNITPSTEPLTGVTDLWAASGINIAAKSGKLFLWGASATQLAATGTSRQSFVPLPIVGTQLFSQIEIITSRSVHALDANGYAWAWGMGGASGALGNGSIDDQSSPVSVLGGRRFSQISAGIRPGASPSLNDGYVLALDLDGYAWAWGNNASGQLGDATITSRSSPVSVLGGRRFKSIHALHGSSYAIDLDDNLWAWGLNFISTQGGYLGDGTITDRSSPVSVIGGRKFFKIINCTVTAFSVNRTVTALDLDGYAWTWGSGNDGLLGNGTSVSSGVSSPVSVLGDRRFQNIYSNAGSVFHSLDLNGYAWAWGSGSGGALGDGTTASKSSPVSVLGGRRFKDIAASSTTIALDLDGYAWAWGLNTFGLLGDGTIASKSSPVSVLGANTFSKVYTYGTSSLGQTTSGEVLRWGLVLSAFDATSSPVAVLPIHLGPSNIFGKRW